MISNRLPKQSSLANYTSNNYNIAQQYYRQRERQFKAMLANKCSKSLKNFIDYLTGIAENYIINIVPQVKNALANKTNLEAIKEKIDSNFWVDFDELFKALVAEKNDRWQFEIGQEFEKYLSRHVGLSNDQQKEVYNFVLQQVGLLRNEAFTTSSKSQTRTDLLVNQNRLINQDEKKSPEQLELTQELIINGENLQKELRNKYIEDDLKEIIKESNINLDQFGFQVKTYPGLGGNLWSRSAPMQNRLTDELTKIWSRDYAILYTMYFLSKYIINIINPVNIAIIYGGNVEIMSSFLGHIRFYMDIQEKQLKNKNKYTVASSEIKMRQFYTQEKANQLKATTSINTKKNIVVARVSKKS